MSLFLILLLASSIGGCVTEPTSPAEETYDQEVVLGSIPNRPIIIEKSLEPSYFTVVLRSDSDCKFDPYPAWSYKLFDQHGLVDFQPVPADPHAPELKFQVPFSGNPPYLFVGDAYACRHIAKSEARGIAAGYELDLEAGYDTNDSVTTLSTENITLERGEKSVSVAWVPDPLVWDLEGGWLEMEPNASFIGAIRVLYPDGTLWGEKRLGPGRASGFQPFQLHPGDYTVEAVADVAAVDPMTFRYAFGSLALHDGVCDHGFKWERCEQPEGAE